jgi:hypothetical protein
MFLVSSTNGYAAPQADAWAPVREGVEAWAALNLDARFSINAGDETGAKFKWITKDGFTERTVMSGASLSKWPSAVMISGLVNDGIMSYDDPANKYLDWWSKDPRDSRSKITLRQLLSFTSGYSDDESSGCGFGGQFLECAQKLYEATEHKYEAGTHWAYLSCHLQFAGAMAVAASGKPIYELFSEYLYKPFNMTQTVWEPTRNPSMAGGIRTTAADFEQLLQRLLTYSVLPKTILDEMETDYSQSPVSPSGDGWFGHYGMGHWWECMGYGTPSERAKLAEPCLEAHIQAGPGEFGFYPLLDRSGGGGSIGPKRPKYYMQVALAEPDALSGVPEYLRIALKPLIDIVMSGGNPDTTSRQELLDLGGGLLERDITYMQGELGDCTCTGAKYSKGEPWKSLTANLKPDSRRENRRDVAKSGDGLLLRDIVQIQKKLGTCTCSGRE